MEADRLEHGGTGANGEAGRVADLGGDVNVRTQRCRWRCKWSQRFLQDLVDAGTMAENVLLGRKILVVGCRAWAEDLEHMAVN